MNLQRAILTALDRVCGATTHFALPEATLQADVNMQLAQPVTLSELRHDLASLEGKSQVVSVRDEDKGLMWKITTNGRARLAE